MKRIELLANALEYMENHLEEEITTPVKVADSISSISQGRRLFTVSHTPERR